MLLFEYLQWYNDNFGVCWEDKDSLILCGLSERRLTDVSHKFIFDLLIESDRFNLLLFCLFVVELKLSLPPYLLYIFLIPFFLQYISLPFINIDSSPNIDLLYIFPVILFILGCIPCCWLKFLGFLSGILILDWYYYCKRVLERAKKYSLFSRALSISISLIGLSFKCPSFNKSCNHFTFSKCFWAC